MGFFGKFPFYQAREGEGEGVGWCETRWGLFAACSALAVSNEFIAGSDLVATWLLTNTTTAANYMYMYYETNTDFMVNGDDTTV